MNLNPSVHASSVLVGAHAILIRGPSGSGKSRLALEIIQAAQLRFTRLVADDRVHLEAAHGRLLARPAPSLAGLIEVRGLGVLRLPYEPVAVVSVVIDIGAPIERMPDAAATFTRIAGVDLPRLAVATDHPFSTVMAALTSARFPTPGLEADAALQQLC